MSMAIDIAVNITLDEHLNITYTYTNFDEISGEQPINEKNTKLTA